MSSQTGLWIALVLCVLTLVAIMGPILLGQGEKPWTLPGIAIALAGIVAVAVIGVRNLLR